MLDKYFSHIFGQELLHLPDRHMGLTVDVVSRQGMRTPLSYQSPPLVYAGIWVCRTLYFKFLLEAMKLIAVRYRHHFILMFSYGCKTSIPSRGRTLPHLLRGA